MENLLNIFDIITIVSVKRKKEVVIMKAVKGYRNFLACLLAVLMIVTTLLPPVAAETEERERVNKKAVFSIDAGRKYFSVEEDRKSVV